MGLFFIFFLNLCHARDFIKISLPLAKESNGQVIEATLRFPKRKTLKSKLPVVLVFGGFEEAARVLELLHPKENIILGSFDYPYHGNRQFHFPKAMLEVWELRKTVRQTQEAISVFIDELLKREDVDKNRLAIVGASLGAPFAIHAAAMRPEFRSLIVVHGFADVSETLKHRLNQLGVSRVFSGLAAGIILAFLNPPVPEDDVMRLSHAQKVLMIEAIDDQYIPKASRALLWEKLSQSKAKVHKIEMAGDHLQPGADALIQKLMDLTFDWLKKENQL